MIKFSRVSRQSSAWWLWGVHFSREPLSEIAGEAMAALFVVLGS